MWLRATPGAAGSVSRCSCIRALLEAIRPICDGTQKSFDELAEFVRAAERGELPSGSTITF